MVTMVEKKYFLIINGTFDRDPVIFEEFPTTEEIANAIISLRGVSARVEERFVLKEVNDAGVKT